MQITIDLSKIDKNKIKNVEYTNQAGEKVTKKDYSFTVVPKKQPKVIKDGDTWTLVEAGFVTSTPTKEDKANKIKMPIIGNAVEFKTKTSLPLPTVNYPEDTAF